MKKYTQIELSAEKLDHVICNVCGKSIPKNKFGYYDDYLSIEKNWGYSSKYDNETHQIDICQDCYEHLLKTLKVNPNSNN